MILFGLFTQPHRRYATLASAIFQIKIRDTIDLLDTFELPDLKNPPWKSKFSVLDAFQDISNYGYFCAVWCRVNLSQLILTDYLELAKRKDQNITNKILTFQNAHLRLAHYLDLCKDPRDISLDSSQLSSLYTPLGQSKFVDDNCSVEIVKTKHLTRPTPLSVIEVKMPHLAWRIETVSSNILACQKHYDPILPINPGSYTIYYKCLTILEQCARSVNDTNDEDLKFALYLYYVSFLDLFYFCLGQAKPDMSDDFLQSKIHNSSVTVLQFYYPYDTRAFSCWDLPDMFHTLCHIRLEGVPGTSHIPFEKHILKSLPFSCQQRSMRKPFVRSLTNDSVSCKVLQHMFWCMVANTYPGTPKRFDMKRLMRARDIIYDRDTIIKLAGNTLEKSSIWIIVAVRAWILIMAKNNKHYIEYAERHVDWQSFEKGTFRRLGIIGTTDIFADNPFESLKDLIENLKDKRVVHRFRKKECANLILDYLRDELKNEVALEVSALRHDRDLLMKEDFRLDDLQCSPIYDIYRTREQALAFCNEKLQHFTVKISPSVKSNILNTLLRLPHRARLSMEAVSMLRLPTHGNLTENSLRVIYALLKTYDQSAKPSHLQKYIGFIEDVRQLKVISWYFSIVCILSRFQLIPLDVDTVVRIEHAMRTVKYHIPQSQILPDSVYDVAFTICCEKILTKTGRSGYGHARICYDIETGLLKCFKKEKQRLTAEVPAHNRKEKRKKIRKEQKLSNAIPCQNCPVVIFSLKGYALQYIPKQNDKAIYRHCPRCASFHLYKWTNWSGSPDGTYRCQECKANEKTAQAAPTCHQCGQFLSHDPVQQKCLDIMTGEIDELEKRVYYCKKHYRLAKKYAWLFPEKQLKTKIALRETKENRKNR